MIEHKLLRDVVKEKFNSLSEGQKLVAQYLIESPEEAAFKTATQVGIEVGVSESTVIRLSHSLGLEGYTQMQQLIRDQYMKTNSPLYKFQVSTEMVEQNNIFANVLSKDLEITNNILQELKEDQLWQIADAVIQADHVFVIGQRISLGPAHWVSFMLNAMLGKVIFLPSSVDVVESMNRMTESSIVVVVSFARYTRETLRYAEVAKGKGARMVAITDKVLSPVGRIADWTLTTEVNTLSGMDSATSIICLLNLIIAGVSSKHQASIKTRLRSIEKEYQRQGIFVDM